MSLTASESKSRLSAVLTACRSDLAALDEIQRLASSRVQQWRAVGVPEADQLWSKMIVENLAPARALIEKHADTFERQLAELDAVGIV